jgi:hypothetical protein
MNAPSARKPRLSFWLQLLLLLLPLLFGYLYQSSGSGNGDSPAYRSAVAEMQLTGELPLVRFEWSHPLHFLLAWVLARILALLELATDPFYALQAINFAALALLGPVLARTWLLYDASRLRAFVAGLAIAVLPAWNWHAQEPLSDVCGHALVAFAICALLALRIQLQGGVSGAWRAALAALLASCAFLFRPGAGLFVPLFAWLGLEALVLARGRRLRLLAAFLCAGLLPIALTYGYYLSVYGVEGLRQQHFVESVHNMQFRGVKETLELLLQWAHHLHRGHGSFFFLLAGTGWLLWLLKGDWRPALDAEPPLRRRSIVRVAWLLALGLVPYFVFLLGNPASWQLRFTLPVQLVFALGFVALLGHLARVVGPFWRGIVLLLWLFATLQQLLLMLQLFDQRQNFVEKAGVELASWQTPDDLVLGEQVAPYTQFFVRFAPLLEGGWGKDDIAPREIRHVLGVRAGTDAGGADFWNQSWRELEARFGTRVWGWMPGGQAQGRVLYSNELAMGGFRNWLRMRGYRERELARFPAEELRNRRDAALEQMSWVAAHPQQPLMILQLLPPPLRIVRAASGDRAELLGALPLFQDVELYFGDYDESEGSWAAGECLPIRIPQPSEQRVLLASGYSERILLPLSLSDRPSGEAWVALWRDPATGQVAGRSQIFFPDPKDDLPAESFEVWPPSIPEPDSR